MAEGKTIGSLLIKIAADTAQLRTGIKQSQADIKSYEKNIGQLKTSLVGAFKSMAIGAGASAAAFVSVKKTIEATQLTSDRFEKAMAEAKGAVDYFLISLSSGDFSNFIQGLKDSIKYAGGLVETLDNLEDIRRGLDITKARSQSELTDLALIYRDKTGKYTKEQRQNAFNQAKAIMEREATDSYNTFVTEADAMLKELAAKTGLTADKIKDIIENYQGNYSEMFSDIQKKMDSLSFGINKGVYIRDVLKGDEQTAAKIWLNYQKASAEKLDAVAKALINQYNAENDIKNINLELIRTYNELFKVQDKITKKLSSGDINKSLADMSSSMAGPFQSSELKGIDLTGIPQKIPAPDFSEYHAAWQKNYEKLVEFYKKSELVIQEFSDITKSAFEDLAVGFGESLGEMMVTGQKMDFSFLLKAFGQLAMSLGKLAIGTGMAGIALKKLMTNPYLAVAAGVALVALGAAATAAANNMVNSSSGHSSSMPASASAQGSDYLNRQFASGYQNKLQIEVVGTIRNDVISISNMRGNKRTERY